MYNEEYIDARNTINEKNKIVNYHEKYRSGYIYFYDNNKILTIEPTSIRISNFPCLKVFSGFIWHYQVDFTNKIYIKNSYTYVLPELGDYLIINLRTGKYEGIIDKQYYNLYNRSTQQFYYPVGGMYNPNLKIEKYTGGMLDGYLYFNEENIGSKQVIQRTTGEGIDDYLFNHKLEIYEVPYIQEVDKKVNESPIVNVLSKKVRVGYSDTLLFNPNNDGIYGLDKTLPKNSIAYENEDSFETNIIATNDNQTIFTWRGMEYEINTSIIDVWINNELQPRNKYSVIGSKSIRIDIPIKTKINAKVYINDVLEPVEEYILDGSTIQLITKVLPIDIVKIEINGVNQSTSNYVITDDIVYFLNPILIKERDIISIRIRSQLGINQYNKYDLLKV